MIRYKLEGLTPTLPANTRKVTRPGKYGNMFKIYKDGKINLWNRKFKSWKVKEEIFLFYGTAQDAVNLYEYAIHQDIESIRNYKKELNNTAILTAIQEHLDYIKKVDFSELKGKNVGCNCKLEEACHADILLKYYC